MLIKHLKQVYRCCDGDRLGGAILFYSALPWPPTWPVRFDRIARWIPCVGMVLAGVLMALGSVLAVLGVKPVLLSGILTIAWIGLTGGLHLDGVADSADGLATTDRQRRLAVMQDSQTGAYGVMAIAAVLLLKTVALISFADAPVRYWALGMALMWGRWGQLTAIAAYPYLRATGKGLIHKTSIQFPQDWLWGTALALLGSGLTGYGLGIAPWQLLAGTISAMAIAVGVGYWLARKFGGHTGDTYGATVEWSEALILAVLTGFLGEFKGV